MEFGYRAMLEGTWEECKERFRNDEGASAWAFGKNI